MSRRYTVSRLAEVVGGTLRGDGSATIVGVGDAAEAGGDQATWVSREAYQSALRTSRAGVVLVPRDFADTPMPAILCENVERSVAALLGAFATPTSRPAGGVHPAAVVHPSARIGESPAIAPHVVIDEHVVIGERCVLHAGVFIGRGAVVGNDCELWPNVVVRDGCRLGDRVIIHPNSVIGADGFGYYFEGGRHNKIPHIGGVWIQDDVEIGACSCVDRAKFGFTVIGKGTKIDNQVQVAHNCRVGEHNVMAGQSGVSGSVRTGNYVVFAARAASFDNLKIGEKATIAGQAMVTKDVPAESTVLGYPAQAIDKEMHERAAVRRLPKALDQVRELIQRVERLEASAHHNP